MMLVAGMALATQGEIKVENDTVTLGGSNVKVTEGSLRIGNPSAIYTTIHIDSIGSSFGRLLFNNGTTGASPGRINYTHSTGIMSIWSGGLEALSLDNNQNVSIPNGSLSVRGGNILVKSVSNNDWGITGQNVQDNINWNIGQWSGGNAALGLGTSDGTRTVLIMSQGESRFGGGHISIPNGNGYLKEGQAIKFTSDGNSGGTVRAGVYVNNDSSLELKTNSTQTTGLKIDSNQKVTIPGELWVGGQRVTAGGSDLDGAQIKTGEVHKDRLWKNKGTEIQYTSGSPINTEASHAGATVMASGRFQFNGSDVTVKLPFDWSGGEVKVYISSNENDFAFSTNHWVFEYTAFYYGLINNKNWAVTSRSNNNMSCVRQADLNYGGVPKSCTNDTITFNCDGPSYYVYWQVTAPMK